MRVSQRLDYALRAAVMLAEHDGDSYFAAGDLADRLGLPRRFVEQQVTALARAGLLDCRRGAAGGCRLARPASEITVRDVVLAVDGDVIDVPHQPASAAAEMWGSAALSLTQFLDGVSLKDLAARQCELDARDTCMYYI